MSTIHLTLANYVAQFELRTLHNARNVSFFSLAFFFMYLLAGAIRWNYNMDNTAIQVLNGFLEFENESRLMTKFYKFLSDTKTCPS